MIRVVHGRGDLSNAAKVPDDFGVTCHLESVRWLRTNVKLDCVRERRANGYMADGGETTGQKLAALRVRSGMSMDDVAREGGWKGRSSVQRYFNADYDVEFLPMDVTQKFAKALVGKGKPRITLQELFTLAGVPLAGVAELFAADETVSDIGRLPRDVPVYGTALGADADFESSEGAGSIKIEQAELDQTEVLGYLRRPPALEGRKDVYGVYVAGLSMFPRFNDGEAVYVDPRRPPMIGDDVVAFLVVPDEHDGDRVKNVLIKRLKRQTSAFYELEQFNPPVSFRIAREQVRVIHRIIPASELLS